MSYSVLNCKADLTSILHGTQLNKINNLNGLFNRTARQLLLDVDPQETKRIVELVGPIFNSVYDYPCPTDLKGNRVIDIRPQVNRTPLDVTTQAYNRDFDSQKGYSLSNKFTMNFNTAVKTLRIAENLSTEQPVLVHPCDSITDDGIWTVDDDATNLTVDNVNYVSEAGSLKFDINASGGATDGVLYNATMTALDLSEFLNQGTFFLYTYLPTAANFTSINFVWGSSASDVYQQTATITQQGTAFQDGWNLIKFNWHGATVVNNPDPTKINFLYVAWNTDGTAQTAVRLDNITCQMGQIMEIEYYSKYLFRDFATGAFQETVNDDSNFINLDTESYNLFLTYLAYLAAQQVQGLDAMFFDGQFFLQAYQEALQRYKGLYKSEIMLPHSTYYATPKPGYGRFFNRRNNY